MSVERYLYVPTTTGQLPYLSHGLFNVAGFEPIVKYVERFVQARDGGRHLDEALSPLEKAQNTARIAHVESTLGDLVVRVPIFQVPLACRHSLSGP